MRAEQADQRRVLWESGVSFRLVQVVRRAPQHEAQIAGFTIDTTLAIRSWDEGAESLLGYVASRILGLPCYETICLHRKEGRIGCPEHSRLLEQAKQGQLPHLLHTEFLRADGLLVCADVHLLSILFGRRLDEIVVRHLAHRVPLRPC